MISNSMHVFFSSRRRKIFEFSYTLNQNSESTNCNEYKSKYGQSLNYELCFSQMSTLFKFVIMEHLPRMEVINIFESFDCCILSHCRHKDVGVQKAQKKLLPVWCVGNPSKTFSFAKIVRCKSYRRKWFFFLHFLFAMQNLHIEWVDLIQIRQGKSFPQLNDPMLKSQMKFNSIFRSSIEKGEIGRKSAPNGRKWTESEREAYSILAHPLSYLQ